MRTFLIGPLLKFAAKLRFKWLFLGTLALFILTLLTPDPFPFADEILFGLATLVLAQWKLRGKPEVGPSKREDSPDVIYLPPDHVRRER